MKPLPILVFALLAIGCASAPAVYQPVADPIYTAIGRDPFWMVAIGDSRIVLRLAQDPADPSGMVDDAVFPRVLPRTVGGVRTSLAPLQDRFAPAQFTNLSDDKKLSAPSFEDMTSGAALGADGFVTGTHVAVGLVYEQQVFPAAGVPAPAAQKLPLPGDVLASLTTTAPEPEPAFALR